LKEMTMKTLTINSEADILTYVINANPATRGMT